MLLADIQETSGETFQLHHLGAQGDPVDGVRGCVGGSANGPAGAVTIPQLATVGTKLSRKFRGLELMPIHLRGDRLKCPNNEIHRSTWKCGHLWHDPTEPPLDARPERDGDMQASAGNTAVVVMTSRAKTSARGRADVARAGTAPRGRAGGSDVGTGSPQVNDRRGPQVGRSAIPTCGWNQNPGDGIRARSVAPLCQSR